MHTYGKKIRDDQAGWHRLETCIWEHSDALFSHGVCPDCKGKFIHEFEKTKKRKQPGLSTPDA